MKKTLLSSLLLGLLASTSYAEDVPSFNIEYNQTPVVEQNQFSQDNYQQSFQQTELAQQAQQTQERVVEKLVQVPVTSKTSTVYKTAPHSASEYINKLAKENGYKIYWQKNISTNDQIDLSNDFFQDKENTWKAKIAKTIVEYNNQKSLSHFLGSGINAYLCDNNSIIISSPKYVSKLYKTYGVSNCEVMLSEEETKYYIDGKEVKPEEIQTVSPTPQQYSVETQQY